MSTLIATDPPMAATSDFDTPDDRTLPTVVYALYLLGLINGLTILIGLFIAYANRNPSASAAQTHYIFQIRSFWIGIACWVVGCVFLMWGIPLAPILIGIPFLILAGLIFALTHIWFAIRCILGLIYVSRGDPYPRPRAWLA
jgi:uncharacterized membrane protein